MSYIPFKFSSFHPDTTQLKVTRCRRLAGLFDCRPTFLDAGGAALFELVVVEDAEYDDDHPEEERVGEVGQEAEDDHRPVSVPGHNRIRNGQPQRDVAVVVALVFELCG